MGNVIDVASLGLGGVIINGQSAENLGGGINTLSVDLNGDGRPEAAVVASAADPGGRGNAGAIYIIYSNQLFPGSIVNLTSFDGITVWGAQPGDLLNGIFEIDDWDGNGRKDIIFSAAGASPLARTGAGTVYVYFVPPCCIPSGTIIDLATFNLEGVRIYGGAAGDRAATIAPAGLWNADTFADIFIGAAGADPGGNTSAGSAYVVFGGATAGSIIDLASLGTQGVTFNGAAAGHRAGAYGILLGDLNASGKNSIAIGAPSANSAAGIAYAVYPGITGGSVINLGSLGSAGIEFTGGAPGDQAAFLADAGDWDFDGLPELSLGISGANSNAGEVQVIFSSAWSGATNLNISTLTSQSVVFQGAAAGDFTGGGAMKSLYNYFGDSRPALAFGARGATPYPGRTGAGSLYVVESTIPMGSVINLATDATTYGDLYNGAVAGDQFGGVVTGFDFNLDGQDDPFTAARTANSGDGQAFILFAPPPTPSISSTVSNSPSGSATISISASLSQSTRLTSKLSSVKVSRRISITPVTTPTPTKTKFENQTIDESTIRFDNSNFKNKVGLIAFDSEKCEDHLGAVNRGIGDVDADGLYDYGISAPDASYKGRKKAGRVLIVYGNQHLIGGQVQQHTLTNLPSYVSEIYGAKAQDRIGTAMSRIGKFNGDKWDDFAISAPYASPLDNREEAGVIYIFWGSKDRLPAQFDLQDFSKKHGIKVIGPAKNGHAGLALANLGDFNDDNIPDFAVAVPDTKYGEVYILWGRNDNDFPEEIDLAHFPKKWGMKLVGEIPSGRFGFALAGNGDINKDYVKDLVISALNAHRVYGIYGNSSFPFEFFIKNLSHKTGFVVEPENPDDKIGKALAVFDFNNDGRDDVFLSAPLKAVNGKPEAGVVYGIFGGEDLPFKINLAKLSSNKGVIYEGAEPCDHAGEALSSLKRGNSVSLLIGAPDASANGELSCGSLYFLPGTHADSNLCLKSHNSGNLRINLANLKADEARIWDGYPAGAHLGSSVDGKVGDINGDEVNDILVNDVDECGKLKPSWCQRNNSTDIHFEVSDASKPSPFQFGNVLLGAYSMTKIAVKITTHLLESVSSQLSLLNSSSENENTVPLKEILINDNLSIAGHHFYLSHFSNLMVSVQHTFNSLYDTGVWRQEIKLHPVTQAPIFTFDAYKAGEKVGSATFYSQPGLCRSEDFQQTNIISIEGVLSQLDINSNIASIPNICDKLPPTHHEMLALATEFAAEHGALRGIARAASALCQDVGYSNMQKWVYHVTYYGLYFTTQYYNSLDKQPALDEPSHLLAFKEAAVNTATLAATNLVCNQVSKATIWASEKVKSLGWTKSSDVLRKISNNAGYLTFFGHTYSQTNSVPQTLIQGATVLATGAMVEETVSDMLSLRK